MATKRHQDLLTIFERDRVVVRRCGEVRSAVAMLIAACAGSACADRRPAPGDTVSPPGGASARRSGRPCHGGERCAAELLLHHGADVRCNSVACRSRSSAALPGGPATAHELPPRPGYRAGAVGNVLHLGYPGGAAPTRSHWARSHSTYSIWIPPGSRAVRLRPVGTCCGPRSTCAPAPDSSTWHSSRSSTISVA